MVNAKTWLDEKYPKHTRKDIKELDVRGENLEGYLDLSDFVNLEILYCHSNRFTGIKFPLKTSIIERFFGKGKLAKDLESEKFQREALRKELEEKISNLDNKFLESEKENNKLINNLFEEKSKLNEEKSQLEISISELQGRITTLSNEIDEKKVILESFTIDQLEEKKKLQEEITNLEKNLGEVKENKEISEKDLLKYNTQLQTKQAEIIELQNKLETEKIQHEQKNEVLREQLEAEKSSIKASQIEWEKATEVQQTQINELERQLFQQQKEVNSLQKRLIPYLEQDINSFVNSIISNNELGRKGKNLLKKLLEEQSKVTNGSTSSEELEKAKQTLLEDEEVNAKEIQVLIDKQKGLIQLQIQLDNSKIQDQQLESRIEISPKSF